MERNDFAEVYVKILLDIELKFCLDHQNNYVGHSKWLLKSCLKLFAIVSLIQIGDFFHVNAHGDQFDLHFK